MGRLTSGYLCSQEDFHSSNTHKSDVICFIFSDNMREVKHVIEHKIPQPQTNLPPINQHRAPPPVIVQQPPPPPQIIPMQQQAPQIIAAPAAPHIIYGNPSPVVHNLGQPERKGGMFNKEG